MNKKLATQGFVSAVCEVLYVALVTFIMNNAQELVSDKPALGPVLFLTLLVTSVAVSGALIFGRSVMLYLDGKKKQSIEVFGYTIGSLAIIIIVLFFAIYLMQ